MHSTRVKLRQNTLHQWIIVPSENEHIAWSGSRWVLIDRDGLSAGDEKALSFATPTETVKYAESVGFDVEHG